MNPFSEEKEGIALDRNRRSPAFAVALGGMLAALAVVIMCLGGLIPIATYVCPIVCSMLLAVMLKLCGRRFAWAWYAVVGILSSLFSPDKEGAAVFLFLGYYPILKPVLDSGAFGGSGRDSILTGVSLYSTGCCSDCWGWGSWPRISGIWALLDWC